ncbi:hypothetical protein MSAN_01136400 [Mycena sanguinolenta]|uniref:Uncharacterized protein n=1 Tax=Mycena sanguinolenta TaxID=230812 RepID=A0A8H6YNE3_9AGAR|nr:hypothetical protein MSAN_01136400 [Mycena sanguinolenta]
MSRTMSNADHENSDLPPKRQAPPLASVSKPLASTRLNRLIYLLLLLSTLLSAYYGYRIVQWKTDVGGWWNLALGKRPPQLKFDDGEPSKARKRGKKAAEETVEDRINALADALGMPSRDLASAIAGAVKQYVPPASLSSVAAHQTGEAVEAMLKGAEKSDEQRKAEQEAEGGGGVVDGIASGMGSFVGMDEP